MHHACALYVPIYHGVEKKLTFVHRTSLFLSLSPSSPKEVTRYLLFKIRSEKLTL